MRDELHMILNMLANDKLSVDEARRLIEALGRDRDGNPLPEPPGGLENVLREVAEHRLTPREAVDRLELRPTSDAPPPPPPRAPVGPAGTARWMRIVVQEGGRQKVNIRLPMGLVNAGLRMAEVIPGKNFNVNGVPLDLRELTQQIRDMGPGRVIEVDDDGDHVEIFLE
jgi:hypothetical protein